MQPNESAVCEAQQSDGQNVCARCHRRRLCGHLAEAMAILNTQPSILVDLRNIRARNALQRRLDLYDFSYPSSLEFCLFSQINANEARQLLFRARDLGLAWTENAELEAP